MPLSPNERRKYQASWARRNPEGSRRYQAKRLYGLTDDEFDELEALRANGCMICGRSEADNKRRLSIDHDHVTGEVRGLLCYNCNTGLGWYERNSEDMEAYLGN